jgi:Tol biopolymer transport system component
VAVRRSLAAQDTQLGWYGRDGRRLSDVPGDGWRNPALSPNDALIAVQRNTRQGTSEDIWIVDAAKSTSRALSSEVTTEESPSWSADGRRVIFQSYRAGPRGQGTARALVDKPLDGSAAVTFGENVDIAGTFVGLTPDTRSILLFRIVAGNRDIVLMPRDGGSGTTFAQTAFDETQPALSPDGKWMAYVSDERGVGVRRDIFIRAFPAGDRKIHVTADGPGGVQPLWRKDGRELYFVSLDQHLNAVSVEVAGDSLRISRPTALFETTIRPEAGLGTRASYDVTRDGQRFVVVQATGADTRNDAPITVLVNWRSAVARGVRATAAEEER